MSDKFQTFDTYDSIEHKTAVLKHNCSVARSIRNLSVSAHDKIKRPNFNIEPNKESALIISKINPEESIDKGLIVILKRILELDIAGDYEEALDRMRVIIDVEDVYKHDIINKLKFLLYKEIEDCSKKSFSVRAIDYKKIAILVESLKIKIEMLDDIENEEVLPK